MMLYQGCLSYQVFSVHHKKLSASPNWFQISTFERCWFWPRGKKNKKLVCFKWKKLCCVFLAANCTAYAHEDSKRPSALQHDFPKLCQQFSASQSVSYSCIRPEYGPCGHPHSETDHSTKFNSVETAGTTHLSSWHRHCPSPSLLRWSQLPRL